MRKINSYYEVIEDANSLTSGLVNENEFVLTMTQPAVQIQVADNSGAEINFKKFRLYLDDISKLHIGQQIIYVYVDKSTFDSDDMNSDPIVTVVSINEQLQYIDVMSDKFLYGQQSIKLINSLIASDKFNTSYPINIYATNYSAANHSIDIRFTPMSDAILHYVSYRNMRDDSNTNWLYAVTNNDVVTLTDLVIGTYYEVMISSKFNDKTSVNSPKITFKTI